MLRRSRAVGLCSFLHHSHSDRKQYIIRVTTTLFTILSSIMANSKSSRSSWRNSVSSIFGKPKVDSSDSKPTTTRSRFSMSRWSTSSAATTMSTASSQRMTDSSRGDWDDLLSKSSRQVRSGNLLLCLQQSTDDQGSRQRNSTAIPLSPTSSATGLVMALVRRTVMWM